MSDQSQASSQSDNESTDEPLSSGSDESLVETQEEQDLITFITDEEVKEKPEVKPKLVFDESDKKDNQVSNELLETRRITLRRKELQREIAELAKKQEALDLVIASVRKPRRKKLSKKEDFIEGHITEEDKIVKKKKKKALKLKKKKKKSMFTETKELPRYKGRFKVISEEEKNFEGKILYLVSKINALKVGYSQLSLLLALMDALPFDLTKEINLNAKLTLEEVLTNLERHFNSPTKLNAAETELENVKYNPNVKFAGHIMVFNTQVATFNARCNSLDIAYEGRLWSRARFFRHVLDKYAITASSKREIIRIMEAYVNIELITDPQLRLLFEYVENICRDEIKMKASQLMIFRAGRNNGNNDRYKYYRDPCYRCDERVERIEGRKFYCNCGKRPVCTVCGRTHMTKHHENVIKMLARAEQMKK